MIPRSVVCWFGLMVLMGVPSFAAAGEPDLEKAPEATPEAPASSTEQSKPPRPKLERATFGGGCFWCMEAVFERVPGVKSAVSGYAGGTGPRPTYGLVSTGLTGHAEVVQLTYDPEVVGFEQLLDLFWLSHDPTSLNRQGPDSGTQYRSVIFYHDEAQRQAALRSYRSLTQAHAFASPIVTRLVPLRRFYPAEKHHQDYFRKNPTEPYCQAEIVPKLMKLERKIQAMREAARAKRAAKETNHGGQSGDSRPDP